MEFFTTKTPNRSFDQLKSLNIAADYIKAQMLLHCPHVEEMPFKVHGQVYRNISCTFNVHQKERIIIGAHYDVANIGPGADDNASGVAGLLELTRLLGTYGKKKDKRFDLVAFSLEEPPFFGSKEMGSYFYAKKIHDEKVPVDFMISLEMIGSFKDTLFSQLMPLPWLHLFYPTRGNFIALIGNYNSWDLTKKLRSTLRRNSTVPIYSMNGPIFIPGIYWSDQLHFWKFGIKGFMLTDTGFYRNFNYHRETDKLETLNFKKMAEVIHALFKTLEEKLD